MPPILVTHCIGRGCDNMQLNATDFGVPLELCGMPMSSTSFGVAFCLHDKLFFNRDPIIVKNEKQASP